MDLKQTLLQIIKSVHEELHKLLHMNGNKEKELAIIQSTSIEKMWLNELDELKKMLFNVNTIKIKPSKKGLKIK